MTSRPTEDGPPSPAAPVESIDNARSAYARRAWADAYHLFTRADEATSLDAEDLERFATAAYLIGLENEYCSALERAYQAYLVGDLPRAARCAFWLGLCHLFSGKSAHANGWLARAQEHVASHPGLVAEEGYLLIPQIERQLIGGDWGSAQATAQRAVQAGERFGEPDLIACARHQLGRALIGAHRVESGFALLDQVMLDVTDGTVSPIMTGLVYCSVLDACQQVFAVARAREWTDALADWCEAQPQMIAFSGTCLIHRAELLQLSGDWPDAIHEARRACDRYAKAQLRPSGAAFYQQAEVHRLRGEYDAAEQCYRDASQSGLEPQPGLALLRLAQGNPDAARGSLRRVVGACDDPFRRARLLPAYVEVMLAGGDVDAARQAGHELADIAKRFDTQALRAMTAQAEGAVALSEGDAQVAVALARQAFDIWQRLGAPYEAARARVLVGLACRALHDDEGAELELDAAGKTLETLGAEPDLARIGALRRTSGSKSSAAHGLTPRELEVLRHVAAGKTNKAIASELFVSDKTIERHLSNLFNKLNVSSRTAAAAYAYEHKLF